MKKIISIILTIFMLAGIMNVCVYAEDDSVTVSFRTVDGTFDPNKGSGDYFYNSGTCNWNIDIPENGYYQLSVNNNYVAGSSTFAFASGNESISEQFTFGEDSTTVVMQDYIYLEKGSNAVKFSTTTGGTIKDFTLTLKEKATLIKFKATDGTLSNGQVNGYYYDGTKGTYQVTIPTNGYYTFTVNHSLGNAYQKTNATLIVTCGNETISEDFEFDNTRTTTVLKDSIYLTKGTQTIEFKTSGGGMVYDMVLRLENEETHIDFNADTFNEEKTNQYGYATQTPGAWWYLDSVGLSYNLDNLPANGVYKLTVWYSINAENTFTIASGKERVEQSAAAVESKTEAAFDNGIYLEKGGVLKFIPSKGGVIYGFRLTLLNEETRLTKSVLDYVEASDVYSNGYFTNNAYAIYDFDLPANGKYDVVISYSGTPVNDETAVTYLNTRYSIAKVAHTGLSGETIVSGLEMYKKDGKVKISGLGSCTVTGVSLVLREAMDSVSLTKLGYATVSAGYNAAAASRVIDGSDDTTWFFNVAGTSDKNISDKWIQINLDAPHKISQIRYLSGKNAAWDMFGKEISIRVSNDPEFGSYKEVASTSKNGAIPTDGATYYDVSVNDQEEYRYIRVAKCVEDSANLAMACAELDVIGSEESVSGNAAINFSQNANVITQLADGSCTAGTVVTNNKETDADYYIIVGLYNENGVMTKCFKKAVTISQGMTMPLSINFEKEEDTVKVQCAVFDGYDTALMVCDSNTLTAE